MSDITENLLGLLETLKADGYINDIVYQRDAKANVDIRTRSLPVVELRSVDRYTYDLSQDIVFDKADVNALFLERQPRLDYDEADNDLRVNRMEWAARQFIARIRSSREVGIEQESISVQVVFDRYDANTTGVNLSFTAVSKLPVCLATYVRHPVFPFLFDDGRGLLFDDGIPVVFGKESGVIVRDPILLDNRETLLFDNGQRMDLDVVTNEVIEVLP